MTPRWLLRYQSRLDVIAMRLAYAALPTEDTEPADYWVADEDGGIHIYSLTPARVEWFAAQHWERVAGQPAVSPELD